MALWCIIITFISLMSSSVVASCPPTQLDALLRLNHSFLLQSIFRDSLGICYDRSFPRTASWNAYADCCTWDGVTCDRHTGDVIGLDLSCSLLYGPIHSNSSLFSLRSLRRLNLAGNYFHSSRVPPEISMFEGMTHLNLSSSSFKGNLPAEISRLSKLVSLDLSDNLLQMPIPTIGSLFVNLTDLEELDLSGNFMEGKLPHYVFQLPKLRKLDLSWNNGLNGALPLSNWSSHLMFLSIGGCSFNGEIPLSISKLRQLTHLDLSGNDFSGPVNLVELSSLKRLRFLGLSGLSVLGEHADERNHKLPMLETLDISFGKLTNFPCVLSITPGLRMLDLQYSVLAEAPGECDVKLVLLPYLEVLSMTNCNMKEFPSFCSHSKELRKLFLRNNMIKEIPSWFWGIGIDTLEVLNVEDNHIQGGVQLPWKRLTYLNLQNNSFEGPLPSPALSIQGFLGSQNNFNGSIPPSICQLTSLDWLDLSGNNLTGIIPRCLGDLTSLGILDLSNNSLTGSLSRSLVNCKSLRSLDVSHNNLNGTPVACLPLDSLFSLSLRDNSFEGQWPVDIFLHATSLGSIYLSGNKFEGQPPPPSFATNEYSIASNNFSDKISSFMCNATRLQLVDMSNNSLTGTLPECLKNTSLLSFLNLRMNKLQGVIPEIFSNFGSLVFLDFSRNRFEGPLPKSLLNCTVLKVLNVGVNRIEDSFPYWSQALPLKVLSLRSNRFSGGLNYSSENVHFSKLRILDLSDNKFEGRLPENLIGGLSALTRADNISGISKNSEYFGWGFYSVEVNVKGTVRVMVKINPLFATLDLSSNRFRGELPGNLGSLVSLKGLNLSHNQLTGSIPPSLGDIRYLDTLDLSSNILFGEVPKELARLSFLGTLNLSYNNLTGKIPSGGQFNTFTSSSFEGNPGLSGFPLTRGCSRGGTGPQFLPSKPSDEGEDDYRSWFEWKFVVMGFGSGTVIGISMGYIVLETGRPLWIARMVLRLEAKFGKMLKEARRSRKHRQSS